MCPTGSDRLEGDATERGNGESLGESTTVTKLSVAVEAPAVCRAARTDGAGMVVRAGNRLELVTTDDGIRIEKRRGP